jgi:hypothetical protein
VIVARGEAVNADFAGLKAGVEAAFDEATKQGRVEDQRR